MRHILRDANRIWYLCLRPDARLLPGFRIDDIAQAQRILGLLLLDAANLAAVRSALASGAFPSSPSPSGIRAILGAMNRRLENREWALVAGPVRVARAPVPARPGPEMVPVERADWRSAEDGPADDGRAAARDPAVAIEVEHDIEPLAAWECGFEMEADGLETGYAIDASEAAPAEASA